MISNYIFW